MDGVADLSQRKSYAPDGSMLVETLDFLTDELTDGVEIGGRRANRQRYVFSSGCRQLGAQLLRPVPSPRCAFDTTTLSLTRWL